jgi:hypothetical protein
MKSNQYISIFLFTFFTFISLNISAQFTQNTFSTGWIQVNASSGVTVKNVVTTQLQMNGPINHKNWSVVARVVSPIINSKKKEFPPEKIKFQYNSYSTEQYYAENYPTINQIAPIQSSITMGYSPVYFVKNSPFVVNTPSGKYGSIKLNYNITIEAGSYLNQYKSWENYPIQLEFSLLNENGNVISTNSFSIDMQISPNGNYETAPSVSITLDGTATNAELIFNTMQNYINGVTKEYQNGLIVSADTAYDIQVSSLNEFLKTNVSDNLDINTVKVQLKDTSTNNVSKVVKLSNYSQSLITNTSSTTAKKYTIIYSTTPADSKILNSKPGNYSATLLYTITPL